MRTIKFEVQAVRWRDKPNGNTYHSVRIFRAKDGKVIVSKPIVYGYEDCYKQTALEIMFKEKWIPKKYGVRNQNGIDNLHLFERENNYPILWNVYDGLKRDMKENVRI
jgi:hypothetical protein